MTFETEVYNLKFKGELGRFGGGPAVQNAVDCAKKPKAVAAHCEGTNYAYIQGIVCDRVVFQAIDDIPEGWAYFADEDFTEKD